MRLTSALRLGQRLNDVRFAGWQCGIDPDKIRWLVRDHVVVETAEANVSSRMMDGCP
jgi:hypothetical protein